LNVSNKLRLLLLILYADNVPQFSHPYSKIGHIVWSNDSVYLQDKKISCLLYADDLILISDSEQGLQDRLNILHKYCKDWCMKININKTKVIIFNKSGRMITRNFNINNQSIECVKTYKYLGIMLTASGKFQQAQRFS
jgi:hypothetical protein